MNEWAGNAECTCQEEGEDVASVDGYTASKQYGDEWPGQDGGGRGECVQVHCE
jgi:hypothetical protein